MFRFSRVVFLFSFLILCYGIGFPGSASASPHITRQHLVGPRATLLSPFATASNASSSDVEAARRIVKESIARMTIANKARLAKPHRNNYRVKPGTKTSKRDENTGPMLLEITDEIAHAAALIAELDVEASSNTTTAKRAGTFWMESLARKGTVPWGNDANYKVFEQNPHQKELTESLIPRRRCSEMLSMITGPIPLVRG
jgi:hypothetical protein